MFKLSNEISRNVYDETGSGQSNMGACKQEVLISHLYRRDKNEIPTAISRFSGSSYPMISTRKLYGETLMKWKWY